jgi:hypothetical protein
MVELYRSACESEHWFVNITGTGWVRFPAKMNGWSERRKVTMRHPENFNLVPLWLAFNTGLLEARETRRMGRAA